MRQSNTYIIGFTAIMTIVVGGLLSLTSQVLMPAQKKSIELDTKTQILGAVMEISKKNDDVIGIYKDRIQSLVVDFNGNIIEKDKKGNPIVAEDVNVSNNFKQASEAREYPVFKYMDLADSTKIEAYIFPIYGNGLWNRISGFVALENDLNTIKGVSFGHVQETPGLGARIADKDIQLRYVGKKIFDDNGALISVIMVKGEKRDPSLYGDHEVDGMSGATLTGKGVNVMLKDYMSFYQKFIDKTKGNS